MVFSAPEFLYVFLPLALALELVSQRLGTPIRVRNAFLALASVVFYLWGSGDLVLLLLASILVNWFLGELAASTAPRVRRAALWSAVAYNLGTLGYFKYSNFAAEQLGAVAALFGAEPPRWTAVVLPIGISFYTFQALSYVIDVHRRDAEPVRDPIDFALYLASFPQLIAGPIVRYKEVAEQIRGRRTTLADFSGGGLRFLHGLFKKVVIGDTLATIAVPAFALPGDDLTLPIAWIGAVASSLHYYFDFSAYSDMAIGMGRMLGFRFPENFRRPLSSPSLSQFWQRWHMTLITWIRDYVYVPLGGSRVPPARLFFNLALTFSLVALWHGAGWTFLCWGAMHTLVLAAERVLGWRRPERFIALHRARTFVIFVIGHAFFNGRSIAHSLAFLRAFVVPTGAETVLEITNRAWVVFGLASVVVLLPPDFSAPERMLGRGRLGLVLRVALLAIGVPLIATVVASQTYIPFIYFQF